MTRLHLSPLPSVRFDEDSSVPVIEREGFVDEALVLALVAGPITQRPLPEAAELALAADDMDFAGWCLPSAKRNPSELSAKRPTPPVQEEPGLGEPHRGNHRWWRGGLAGVMSTLLFSALLLSLSSRIALQSEGALSYTWSSSVPATATVNATGVVTGVATGTTNITYTVTDANGC